MWSVQYVRKAIKWLECLSVCGAADKIYVLLFVLWNAPSYILNYILVFSCLFFLAGDIVACCLSLIISHLPQSNIIETERSFHSTATILNVCDAL